MGKQEKGIKRYNNYIPERSYLTISIEGAQELADKYAGMLELIKDSKRNWNNNGINKSEKYIGIYASRYRNGN